MKVTLRSLELGSIPHVVAVLDRPVPLERIRILTEEGVDIFEIRADLFGEPFARIIDYANELRHRCVSPLIGTIRSTADNDGRRLSMFAELVPLVDCVDIEID